MTAFPGYPIQSLEKQIQAIELLSEKPVVAVTLNHEGLTPEEIPECCDEIHRMTGVPAFDVLRKWGPRAGKNSGTTHQRIAYEENFGRRKETVGTEKDPL